MKCRKCSVSLPFVSVKMFLPVFVSTTDWWMCMALPGSPSIGLAMKVAKQSCRSAASRISALEEEDLVGQPHRIAVRRG